MKLQPVFLAFAVPALALASGVVTSQPAPAATRLDAARDAYEVGHYEHAFAQFAALADEGLCDAARIAQQMVRYGRTLYSTEFKVGDERLRRWQTLPACPVALAAR